MRKFGVLFVVIMLVTVLVSCQNVKKEKNAVNIELEGYIKYNYYFNESEILITNQDRLMYSDWEDIEFDYICTDPSCGHKSDSCTAYAINSASRREKNSAFAVQYDNKLIIFEEYTEHEQKDIDKNKTEIITKYYTHVYEAELDGSDRKHKLTVEGSSSSEITTSGVVVVGGYVLFGGEKESTTIIEYKKDSFQQEIVEETIQCDSGIFAIDLSNYTVKEYAADYNKSYDDYSVKFFVYGGKIYVQRKSMREDIISIYCVDVVNEKCELLFEEDSSKSMQGVLGDRCYYSDNEYLYYRHISNPKEEYIFEAAKKEGAEIADIVDDKLALVTKFEESDGKYEVEYTFYDADGNEVEKHTYNEHVVFWGMIGDKLIFVKPYAEQQMWWTDVDDIGNLFENAKYIGSFRGGEHDSLGR